MVITEFWREPWVGPSSTSNGTFAATTLRKVAARCLRYEGTAMKIRTSFFLIALLLSAAVTPLWGQQANGLSSGGGLALAPPGTVGFQVEFELTTGSAGGATGYLGEVDVTVD